MAERRGGDAGPSKFKGQLLIHLRAQSKGSGRERAFPE